jgi:hypothetical protein
MKKGKSVNQTRVWAWVVGFAASLLLTACGIPSNTAGGVHGRELRASGTAEDGTAILPPPQSSDQNVASSSSGSGNPHAKFKGCWYKEGKNRYQAVDMAIGTAGTYAFNAILYYGKTCNKDDFADQFGYGQLLSLGEFDYIFWFTAFPNQTNMSALWYLGDETSQCVSYADAPDCE